MLCNRQRSFNSQCFPANKQNLGILGFKNVESDSYQRFYPIFKETKVDVQSELGYVTNGQNVKIIKTYGRLRCVGYDTLSAYQAQTSV